MIEIKEKCSSGVVNVFRNPLLVVKMLKFYQILKDQVFNSDIRIFKV